jgi:hypothetical protein
MAQWVCPCWRTNPTAPALHSCHHLMIYTGASRHVASVVVYLDKSNHRTALGGFGRQFCLSSWMTRLRSRAGCLLYHVVLRLGHTVAYRRLLRSSGGLSPTFLLFSPPLDVEYRQSWPTRRSVRRLTSHITSQIWRVGAQSRHSRASSSMLAGLVLFPWLEVSIFFQII